MTDRSTVPAPRRPGAFERFLKRLAAWIIVLAVAFGAGGLWQYSARRVADARAADATLRVPLLEARGFLLQARLDLQAANFGDARRNLQQARDALDRAAKTAADPAIRQRVDAAVARTLEAQSLAAQVNITAMTPAASASGEVDAALGAMPRTSEPR